MIGFKESDYQTNLKNLKPFHNKNTLLADASIQRRRRRGRRKKNDDENLSITMRSLMDGEIQGPID